MIKVRSKALDKEIEIDRLIGKVEGNKKGPSVIFIGGMHGNEPSGVFALNTVLKKVKEKNIPLHGNFYALSGNHAALADGVRYEKHDLNRLWTRERIKKVKSGQLEDINQDIHELIAIHEKIEQIIEKDDGPFYFVDLHTTSAESMPFIAMNDTLINRKYCQNFPVPIVIGLEEFIEGPLLSYMTEIGYVGLAFEAGQHDDLSSIEIHEAFIWLSLVFAKVLNKKNLEDYDHQHGIIARSTIDSQHIFEIRYRYGVKPDEGFVMKPGFVNFQHIEKRQHLADNKKGPIKAIEKGRVFMPLYQKQGDDGFFIIKEIPEFWLKLSAFLRRINFENLLLILPGVRKHHRRKHTLIVDPKVAKILARDFFHLMGYRKKQLKNGKLHFTKRKYDTRGAGKMKY